MAKPIRVAVVVDDAQAVAGLGRFDAAVASTGETVTSTNAKINRSNVTAEEVSKKTVDARIAGIIRLREASRLAIADAQRVVSAGAGAPAGSRAAEEAAIAQGLIARENAKLERSYGRVTAASAGFSSQVKKGENEFSKAARGAAAGSGIFGSLGRSLIFASSGFVAFEVGAGLIAKSITSAEDLEKAQASLGVAIQHTGGNLTKLTPQYKATAEAAANFGIDQATATTGLARATVLTGDAAAAQRAYQEALVISKATGKDFNATLIATSKGQEGITTSLRRYGILVDATTTGQKQFNLVMSRFGGQASANTTSLEKLNAQFTNALQTIGLELLPTVNRLADGFGGWLEKMNKSGKLQKDVTSGMHAIHDAASPLIGTIKDLAGAVGTLNSAFSDFSTVTKHLGLGSLGVILKGGIENITPLHSLQQLQSSLFGSSPAPPRQSTHEQQQRFGLLPRQLFAGAPGPASTVFGSAQPLKQFWKGFALTYREQLAQVRASMTQTSKDDVAEAKQEIARIKGLIDQGRLHGPALLAALQLEASAVNTIESAAAAAAQRRAAAIQKRAAAAQAAKAKIQAAIENSIDPLKLQVRLARDEATNNKADLLKTLRAMRTAARKAIASGKLSQQQLIEAYNQITQLNQQITDAVKKQNAAGRSAFKQVNQHKFLSGLELTPAQRRALRQRLAQIGPGGTVGSDRVGAYGYQIGDNGRPIHVHTRVDIDGHKVAENTTKHQRRRRRRNSSQRRGPSAGDH